MPSKNPHAFLDKGIKRHGREEFFRVQLIHKRPEVHHHEQKWPALGSPAIILPFSVITVKYFVNTSMYCLGCCW